MPGQSEVLPSGEPVESEKMLHSPQSSLLPSEPLKLLLPPLCLMPEEVRELRWLSDWSSTSHLEMTEEQLMFIE